MGLLLCICVNAEERPGNEANMFLFCHSVSWLLFCFFVVVVFPKNIYSASYNLLGIFAPGCVFRSTATVDLEFDSTLTWVLYHLEVIVCVWKLPWSVVSTSSDI